MKGRLNIAGLSREQLQNIAHNFVRLEYLHFTDILGQDIGVLATTAPDYVAMAMWNKIRITMSVSPINLLVKELTQEGYYAVELNLRKIKTMRVA